MLRLGCRYAAALNVQDQFWMRRAGHVHEVPILPDADAKHLPPILRRYGVRPTVEWSVRTASSNSSLEKLSLRAGPSEALHRPGIDLAVVVVGGLEPNDHIPLCAVVADSRYVTVLFDVHTCESVKWNGPQIPDLNSFRRGDLAYQGERRNGDESQLDSRVLLGLQARSRRPNGAPNVWIHQVDHLLKVGELFDHRRNATTKALPQQRPRRQSAMTGPSAPEEGGQSQWPPLAAMPSLAKRVPLEHSSEPNTNTKR